MLDRVADRLFIGGEWVDAEGGKTLAVTDPSTGETIKEIADAVAGRRHPCARRRRGRPGRVGRDRAPRARRAAAPGVRPAAGAQGGLRAAHDARDGQAARRGARRGRLRRRVPALVQRGGRAHLGPLRAEPRGHRPHDRLAAPGRPVVLHHPVELPARDGDPQDRPRARRRLHRGDQARRRSRRSRPSRSCSCSRRSACPPASSTSSPTSTSSKVSAPIIADPRLRKLSLHRLDRGRPHAHAAGRAGHPAHARWSSAATRRSSSSRTPTSTRRSTARCSRSSATSARPAPRRTASSCTSRSPTSSRRASPSASRRCASVAAPRTASPSAR